MTDLDAIPAYFPPPPGTALAGDATTADKAAETEQEAESTEAAATAGGSEKPAKKTEAMGDAVAAAADPDPEMVVKEDAPVGGTAGESKA